MPRRNLTATKISVHPKFKPHELIPLDGLPDVDADDVTHDYLHMFHGFVQDVTHEHLHHSDKEQWTAVKEVATPKGRTLLVAADTGKYGEEGTAVDIDTGLSEFDYGANHSIQVTTHGVLIVPKGAKYAILFQERSNGRCGAGRIHDVFIKAFKSQFPKLQVKTAPFLESEAWLEAAHLMEIQVEVIKPSSDEADFDIPSLSNATYSYNIRPASEQKFLPRKVYDQLMGKNIKPGQLVSLTAGEETGKVFVTMAKDGRRKSFELHKENSPVASLLLSNHGEEAPTQNSIYSSCLKEAADYFPALGIEWNESQAHGKWTDQLLQIRTVKPLDEQT